MNLISSCKLPWPKVTNQVKTTSISWQVSSQISSHLAMWGVFGIQLLDNKTKGKGRRTQKNMNLGLGFGLLDGSFVCDVSHVHASLVLSILFHSFWVLCGSVQPPTRTSKHATSSMAVKPSYLSRELWGYCIPGPMQQYRRLFQLGNRWKTKPEHIMTWIVEQFCIVHPCIQHQRTFFSRNQPSYLDFLATHNFSSSQIHQFASEPVQQKMTDTSGGLRISKSI